MDTLDLERESWRDWVSDRDLGVKYDRGAERVDKTRKRIDKLSKEKLARALFKEIISLPACP